MATSLFCKRPLALLTASALLPSHCFPHTLMPNVSAVILMPFTVMKMAIWLLIVQPMSRNGSIQIH